MQRPSTGIAVTLWASSPDRGGSEESCVLEVDICQGRQTSKPTTSSVSYGHAQVISKSNAAFPGSMSNGTLDVPSELIRTIHRNKRCNGNKLCLIISKDSVLCHDELVDQFLVANICP